MRSEGIRILVVHTFVPSHSLSLPEARQRANITFSGPDTLLHANALACGLIEPLSHQLQAHAHTKHLGNWGDLLIQDAQNNWDVHLFY